MEQLRKKPKIYTRATAPKGLKSPVGKPIYEWEYMDKDGKIQKSKKNQQEQIQSHLNGVDYKKMIKDGTLINDSNGNYGDVSALQLDNQADAVLLAEFIGSLSQEQVTALLQQRVETSINRTEGQEVVTEGTQENQETSTPTVQTTNNTDGGTN